MLLSGANIHAGSSVTTALSESQNQPVQPFDRFLCVTFQGSRVTSEGGLILVWELNEQLGSSGLIEEHLMDSRTGRNRQFPLGDLLRQSVYSRLAGYEDLSDAARWWSCGARYGARSACPRPPNWPGQELRLGTETSSWTCRRVRCC